MYDFKVRNCVRGRSHDWTECPYAHPGEKARRRDTRKYNYSGNSCPNFRKGSCTNGDSCEFAHGVFECWLHPTRYRTQPCKDGRDCTRRICFFAHTPDQIRVTSPRGNGSGPGELDLFGSPKSILTSLPISPPSNSPPMSPYGSVIQLNKMKTGPNFGSPRGSTLRAGFFSLPSTPAPARIMPGPWGCGEEPEMERVESGRDLRAKMYAKLSKENWVDQVGYYSGSGPDIGWVFELVN